MTRLALAALVLLASACAHQAPAARREPERLPVPESLRAEVARAEQLGELIYRHDQAAWVGTDVLFYEQVLPQDGRVRGWLTELVDEDRSRVLFVGEVGGELRLLHTVELAKGEKPRHVSPSEPFALTAEQQGMFRARQLALHSTFDRCSRDINPVVFSASAIGEEGWLVYLLASSNQKQDRVIGGHQRFRISLDGSRVLEQKAMTRGCVTLQVDDSAQALVLTHGASHAPTETHLFATRMYKEPLFLAIDDALWALSDGKVEYLLVER